MKRISVILAGLLAGVCAFGQQTWAVVNFSSNFMREKPDYDQEVGNQALMGTVVKVIGHQGDWTLVESPEPYQAWVVNRGLVEMSEEQKDAYVAEPKLICTREYDCIRLDPTETSAKISDLVMGDILRGTGRKVLGWTEISMPDGQKGWVRSAALKDFGKWAESRVLNGDNVESLARQFMGVPYMWGGKSIKHVDCSGLTSAVYFMLGVLLPRNASQQAKVGDEVPLDSLQKGDLLFFGRAAEGENPERISHVAIYVGDGRIIHSSYLVRENSIIPGAGNYTGRTPLHARRIIGCVDSGKGITSLLKSPLYFKQ